MVYKTKGVCAQGIEFEIDDNKKFTISSLQADVPETHRVLHNLQREWMQMK